MAHKRSCAYGKRVKGKCPRKKARNVKGPRCAGLKPSGKLRKGYRFVKGGSCPIKSDFSKYR